MTRKTDPRDPRDILADAFAEHILGMSEEEIIQMTVEDGLYPDQVVEEVRMIVAGLEASVAPAPAENIVDLAARRADAKPAPDSDERSAPVEFRMAALSRDAADIALAEDAAPSVGHLVLQHTSTTAQGVARFYEDFLDFYVSLPPDAVGATELLVGGQGFPLVWVEDLRKYRVEGLSKPAFADFIDGQHADPDRGRLSWT